MKQVLTKFGAGWIPADELQPRDGEFVLILSEGTQTKTCPIGYCILTGYLYEGDWFDVMSGETINSLHIYWRPFPQIKKVKGDWL